MDFFLHKSIIIEENELQFDRLPTKEEISIFSSKLFDHFTAILLLYIFTQVSKSFSYITKLLLVCIIAQYQINTL